MRTNIDIDDRLMRQAMRHTGARTKKATVEAGLRLLVDTHAQGAIRRLKGKVRWEGNQNKSRNEFENSSRAVASSPGSPPTLRLARRVNLDSA